MYLLLFVVLYWLSDFVLVSNGTTFSAIECRWIFAVLCFGILESTVEARESVVVLMFLILTVLFSSAFEIDFFDSLILYVKCFKWLIFCFRHIVFQSTTKFRPWEYWLFRRRCCCSACIWAFSLFVDVIQLCVRFFCSFYGEFMLLSVIINATVFSPAIFLLACRIC